MPPQQALFLLYVNTLIYILFLSYNFVKSTQNLVKYHSAVNTCIRLLSLWQNTWLNNLKDEGFILVHGFSPSWRGCATEQLTEKEKHVHFRPSPLPLFIPSSPQKMRWSPTVRKAVPHPLIISGNTKYSELHFPNILNDS